jgi:hypothetical protein
MAILSTWVAGGSQHMGDVPNFWEVVKISNRMQEKLLFSLGKK